MQEILVPIFSVSATSEIQRSERPFERLEMDILGPFPVSKSGKKSIVAVDNVTKWAETRALPNADASEVADFFMKCVLLRHEASH